MKQSIEEVTISPEPNLNEARFISFIDVYYKGFHAGLTARGQNAVPQKESLIKQAEEAKKAVEKLIQMGFEPSWNKETSKEQLKTAGQEFLDSISDPPVDPTAPICGVHHTKMSWKTGISKKTGKRYAFWGCDQHLPDGSFCNFKPIMPEGT